MATAIRFIGSIDIFEVFHASGGPRSSPNRVEWGWNSVEKEG